MYKQNFIVLIAAILLLVIAPIAVSQVQTELQTVEPSIIVFYEEGCPACIRMKELLDALVDGHEEIVIARYELGDPGVTTLLLRLSVHHGVLATSVPVIFIGDTAIVGAGRAEEFQLRTAVSDCVLRGCPSPLAALPEIRFPWRDLLVLGAFAALFLFLFVLQ